MEVVYILGDDGHFKVFFQFRNDFMGPVGLRLFKLAAPFIVKTQDEPFVAVPSLDVRHVGYVVVFPESVAVAKGLDTALGTDAGAG